MTATRVTHHQVFFYCLYQRASKGNTEACSDKCLGVLACSQRVRIFMRLCALALVFLTEKILAYLKAHKASLYPFKMLQNVI